MRRFPIQFESKKKILFYPDQPETGSGDILEIGFGRGEFLQALAENCPDKKIIGVELDKKRYFKMIPRLERSRLTNVLLVQGNARIILPQILTSASLEKIYILFPDPWPKRRHRPHRLLSNDFLELLANLLKTNGNLFCATDFWAYAEMVVDNLRSVKNLENVGSPYFVTIDDVPHYQPSFYEKKWREEGRAIYYIKCRKI